MREIEQYLRRVEGRLGTLIDDEPVAKSQVGTKSPVASHASKHSTGGADSIDSYNFTWTGTHNFTTGLAAGSQLITNVLDPVSAQDAATKNYVDTEIAAEIAAAGHVEYDPTAVTDQVVTNYDTTGLEVRASTNSDSWTTALRVNRGALVIANYDAEYDPIFYMSSNPATPTGHDGSEFWIYSKYVTGGAGGWTLNVRNSAGDDVRLDVGDKTTKSDISTPPSDDGDYYVWLATGAGTNLGTTDIYYLGTVDNGPPFGKWWFSGISEPV